MKRLLFAVLLVAGCAAPLVLSEENDDVTPFVDPPPGSTTPGSRDASTAPEDPLITDAGSEEETSYAGPSHADSSTQQKK